VYLEYIACSRTSRTIPDAHDGPGTTSPSPPPWTRPPPTDAETSLSLRSGGFTAAAGATLFPTSQSLTADERA